MKLTFVFLTAALLTARAGGIAQTVTLSGKNLALKQVFTAIEKQTGYVVFYNQDLLKDSRPVTVSAREMQLGLFLDAIFEHQDLTYSIMDRSIVLSRKPAVVSTADQSPAIPISGRILDADGKPLEGASVLIKNSKISTRTNATGYFTLDVEVGQTLVVSFVGYGMKEIKIASNADIPGGLVIRLDPQYAEEEEVVVAYNRISQRSNTGAVTVVKGDDIQTLPNRSVDKSLQGLVPGLLVTSGSGQPGGGLSNFVLRGIATAGNTVNPPSTIRNPLIVIDGIPVTQDAYPYQTNYSLSETAVVNPMAQLNPSDIDNISVLKDAAAVALYGAKASNGVILITTKKGKVGKPVFSFRHQTDIAQRLKGKIELLNPDAYLDLLYETFANSGYANRDSIRSQLYKRFPVIVKGSDTSFYPFSNWEDELYKKTALSFTNELSLSGGSEKSHYYLNLEYSKQDGIVKKTGYDRKSLRFNFENRPTSFLKIGLNTALSYNVQDFATLTGSGYYSLAGINSPLNPIRLEDGNYFFNFQFPVTAANPAAVQAYNKNRNTSFRGLSKLSAELSFLKRFKFSSALGVDFMFLDAYQKNDPRLYDTQTGAAPNSATSGRIQQQNNRTSNLITTNILNYNQSIATRHAISILAGQEAQILYTKNISITGTGFRNPAEEQVLFASTKTSSDLIIKQTLLSYFGQANYSFANKYFFTSSLRTDGSSLFGEKNRFKTFWSTGLGWVITEEKFMQRSSAWLNFLKIRGSIGASGNSFVIDRTTRFDAMERNVYLNNVAYTYTYVSGGNDKIKPERTFNWDMGLETHILNNRIAITADVYKRKTIDVIYPVDLPLGTGFITMQDNLGDMENKGVELSFSANIIKKRNFNWSLNANWSTNKNVLTKANVTQITAVGGLTNRVGKNFNSYYMIRWAGVDPATGNAQWFDSAGNIITTYSSADKDRVYVGKPQPDGFGAITNTLDYKNFQIAAVFYYQYGFQVYNNAQLNLTNDGNNSNIYMNQDKRALDRWQKPGDEAANPKRKTTNTTTTSQSTRFLYDGDFIRLQNVALAYNVPFKIVHRLGLSTIKFYATAYNVAIWTKFPGGDIANTTINGGNGFSYPNSRSYSFGMNVNF